MYPPLLSLVHLLPLPPPAGECQRGEVPTSARFLIAAAAEHILLVLAFLIIKMVPSQRKASTSAAPRFSTSCQLPTPWPFLGASPAPPVRPPAEPHLAAGRLVRTASLSCKETAECPYSQPLPSTCTRGGTPRPPAPSGSTGANAPRYSAARPEAVPASPFPPPVTPSLHQHGRTFA